LHYYEKKYDLAVKKLNRILNANENQKTYELKGLVLKSSGNFEEAKRVYKIALSKMRNAGLAKSEGLNIYFEMAVIELIEKRYESAKKLFDYCIAKKFNLGAAKIFRGSIFAQFNNINAAVLDFRSVLDSEAVSLRALAALNLADLSARSQQYEEAIYFLAMARELADVEAQGQTYEISGELLTLRRQVSERINESIAKVNEAQFFRSIALILSHDTNVLSVPFSGSVADIFTNKSSSKTIAKALFGKADGFFQEEQKIWSYQFSGNINQNKETETGQFLANEFNYQINKKPYAAQSTSLRFNAAIIFQYQVNPGTEKGLFGPYSAAVVLAKGYRNRLSNVRAQFTEYSVRLESFLQDPAFSNYMKKTGADFSATHFEGWDKKIGKINPTFFGSIKYRHSAGEEYRNGGATIGVANQLYFSHKQSANASASISYNGYFQRPGTERHDQILNLAWDQNYQINNDLAVLLNLEYLDNNSNISDIYKFDRYSASIGASYSF